MKFNWLLLTLLFPVVSNAYSYIDNRSLFPIGEIEAFMANTGIAVSGSTGAVYYNPAGLVSLTQNHLSISANSYLSTSGDVKPVESIDGIDFNFHVKGLQTVPTSFVSTGRSGDLRYAFSILIPHQLKVQDSTSYSTPHYPNTQFSRTNSFQLLQAGPSVATRLQNLYDVGAGCFFTLYTTTQETSLTGSTNGAANALVVNGYYDASVTGLMCNAGVQVRLTENLRAGAVVRSPLLPLSKTGTSMRFVQSPNTGLSFITGPKGVDADYRIPLELGAGVEYRFTNDFTSYLDGNLQAAQTFNTGDIGTEDSKNNATARASAGVSFVVNPTIQLFAGLAYNPSSVAVNANDYGENFVEATLGSRWSYSNTNLGIGLIYARSRGTKDAPTYDYQLNQTGMKTADVSTTAYGILLSSGYLF